MRLLIVSIKQHLADYSELAEALDSIGVETLVVHNLKYCFLCERPPLHTIPLPKLLKLVKRFNPDFVMTDYIFYVSQMVKLVNQRVLFHMRGDAWSESYWEKAMQPSLLMRLYRHYLARLGAQGIKETDLILPNSKWLQRRVKQHLPNHPTRLLYVGIDPEKWVPSLNAGFNLKHPAVVGLFKFNIYQKVLGLLRFTDVIRKMPDVNFYFAGIGPYISLVKRNCPSNMFLLGWLPYSEVTKLVRAGDVFIHPSGADAFPRGLKEASLMEKPIVASNVGGIPEIVKDNETGYLCNINDVDQWVEKIRCLLDNPDVARRFGKNAREFVMETFNWRKIANDLRADLGAFAE